jgi:phosphate transport system permease protein
LSNFVIIAVILSCFALLYSLLPYRKYIFNEKLNDQNKVDTSNNLKIFQSSKNKKGTTSWVNQLFSIGIFSGPSWSKAGQATRKERVIVSFIIVGACFVISILFYIISDVIIKGSIGFDLSYLYEVEIGAGGSGGFLNAITGSLELVALSVGIAFPLALGSAIYIQEYAKKDNLFTRIIMFASDTLASTPSIVFGAFGFIFFVVYLGFGVSLLAGALTLACMALPILLRSCIEAIKAIPSEFQEGSLALGASKWQTIVKAVLPPAMIMITSGVIIAMGRVIGETAAVMFSAGYLSQVSTKLLYPIASLPIMIWQYFQYGPLNEIVAQKMYSASLVLIIIVLFLNTIARIVGWRFGRMMKP